MAHSRRVHLNAYEVRRAGAAGPLADASLPADQPIVTVCNMRRVSQVTANVLVKRGLDALAGGMKAWSRAWNIADVPLCLIARLARSRMINPAATGQFPANARAGTATMLIDWVERGYPVEKWKREHRPKWALSPCPSP